MVWHWLCIPTPIFLVPFISHQISSGQRLKRQPWFFHCLIPTSVSKQIQFFLPWNFFQGKKLVSCPFTSFPFYSNCHQLLPELLIWTNTLTGLPSQFLSHITHLHKEQEWPIRNKYDHPLQLPWVINLTVKIQCKSSAWTGSSLPHQPPPMLLSYLVTLL